MNNFKKEDFKFNGDISSRKKPEWEGKFGNDFIKIIDKIIKEGK